MKIAVQYLLFLGLALLVSRSVLQAEGPAIRMDGLVALIGGTSPGPGVDFILHSDVELRARIILSGQTSGPLPLGSLSTSLLKATLNEMIGEFLIAREARRVRVTTPSLAAIRREQGRLEQRAGGSKRFHALMETLSVSSQEIEEIARRRALVAAFLSANLEGTTTITDSEIERAREQKGVGELSQTDEDNKDIAEARESLRARLAREALDRAIARWVNVLRTRTPVHLFGEYSTQR